MAEQCQLCAQGFTSILLKQKEMPLHFLVAGGVGGEAPAGIRVPSFAGASVSANWPRPAQPPVLQVHTDMSESQLKLKLELRKESKWT